MVMFGRVEDQPDIEAQVVLAADLIGCGVEDLGTQRRQVRQPPLNQPTDVPEIPISFAEIRPVPSSALGGPGNKAPL